MRPDSEHRVNGTTYPSDRAPDGADVLNARQPGLASRLLTAITSIAVSSMRLREGDVLVVRGDVPRPIRLGIVRALHKGMPGDPTAIFLPLDCAVHVEKSQIEKEDRGHRDTKNIERDKAKVPARGVFTGVQDGRDAPADNRSR